MDILFKTIPNACHITLSGRCEGFDYLDLQKQIEERIAAGEINFIFDISEVNYISSTSLATICSYVPDCDKQQGKIIFVGATERVLSILECLKITSLLPVVETLDMAVEIIEGEKTTK
jgi:anti-anti-sigma factor